VSFHFLLCGGFLCFIILSQLQKGKEKGEGRNKYILKKKLIEACGENNTCSNSPPEILCS